MKKWMKIALVGIPIAIGGGLFIAKPVVNSLIGFETMDLKKAEQRWGNEKFDPTKFKIGDENTRSSMAVDLVRSGKYIGAPFSTVRQELGEWVGYFERDSIPAYFIDNHRLTKGEVWQVVFLPDKGGREIGEIVIHTNCCD